MKKKLKFPIAFYPVMMVFEVVFLYCFFVFFAYDFKSFYNDVFWWAVFTSIVLTILTERVVVVKKRGL